MAWSVFDILDQVFGFAKGTNDQFNDLNVCFFIVSANIIASPSIPVRITVSIAEQWSLTKPVSDLHAISIDW